MCLSCFWFIVLMFQRVAFVCFREQSRRCACPPNTMLATELGHLGVTVNSWQLSVVVLVWSAGGESVTPCQADWQSAPQERGLPMTLSRWALRCAISVGEKNDTPSVWDGDGVRVLNGLMAWLWSNEHCPKFGLTSDVVQCSRLAACLQTRVYSVAY